MFGTLALIFSLLTVIIGSFSMRNPVMAIISIVFMIASIVLGIIGIKKKKNITQKVLSIIGISLAGIFLILVIITIIISTQNALQQRSLLVGQQQESSGAITDAVDVVSILSASNATSETFNDFEILIRLSPGSDPIQMRSFNIQFISPNFDESASFKMGNCSFDNLTEKEYCFHVMNGNEDYVLGSGERLIIYYHLEEEHALKTGDYFQFIFTTEKGRLSEARARTPDVVTSTKAKLWPLG